MTDKLDPYLAAYACLPRQAVWRCSFGFPGEGGFQDWYNLGDTLWIISNGTYGDEWKAREIPGYFATEDMPARYAMLTAA
jgi:hypothetical protein